MRKLFHFDSPRERYDSDGVVLWCFDNRFDLACRKFLKYIGIMQPDPIKVAGGPKSLASPAHSFHREFILEQIHNSIRLHNTSRVILMMHADCGAYGGLANFGGDAAVEAAHHSAELARAAKFLNQVLPQLKVDCFFINFEGVWEVPIEDSAKAVRG